MSRGIRYILLALAVALCLPLFSCGAGPAPEGSDPIETVEPAPPVIPEDLLMIARGNETAFQIVYAVGADASIVEGCNALADAIATASGVRPSVVHDSMPETECEILVGDVFRMELLSVKEGFALDQLDYGICVEGKKILIVGNTDYATLEALRFFGESVAYSDGINRIYGVKEEYRYVLRSGNVFSLTVIEQGTEHVDFIADAATSYPSFFRVSFAGNGAWRIQTKKGASYDYEDIGASQLLSVSLGEKPYEASGSIECTEADRLFTMKASDGTRAVIDREEATLHFYSASDSLAATVTEIDMTEKGGQITGQLLENEAVFGTGGRFNTVNQRGNRLEMFSADLWSRADANYVTIPLLCFSRGAGVFVNRYERMVMDLGSADHDVWSASVSDAPMDCYIFATDRISEALYGYTELSGHADQPEEWSYGMIVCRYAPDLSQKWSVDVTPFKDNRRNGVYDTIAMMEKYDLPWTGVLVEGWGLNSKRRDLEELCDYVHSLGKKLLAYTRMGAVVNLGLYAVTQKTPDGNISSIPDIKPGVFNPDRGEGVVYKEYIDITNPFAREDYFEGFWGRYFDEIGVDGVKVDFCELMPEDYPYNYFNTYGTSIANKGTHHWYPTAYSVMLYERLAEKADGGMLYIRGGGIGLQRAPYVWGGDQKRVYESLGFQLTASLSMGMSGLPYFSYDMAGYQYQYSYHGTEEQLMRDSTREIGYESRVFIRGLQYSAFTICMQMHGSVRNPFDFAEYTRYYVNGQSVMLFYDQEAKREYVYCNLGDGKQKYHIYDDNDRRYVQRDDVKYYVTAIKDGKYAYVTDVYRAYVKLHELLTPYITEYAEIASLSGMPLMRHPVLHWQDDATVYNINDEYMFGDAFLVAPVLDERNARDVYLPEGKWIDLNTGEMHTVKKGGKWLRNYSASLAELPVFFNTETSSDTAGGLVAGIEEIFDYLKTIDVPA